MDVIVIGWSGTRRSVPAIQHPTSNIQDQAVECGKIQTVTSDELQTVLDLFHRAANDRCRGASEIEMELVRGLVGTRQRWRSADLIRGARVLAEGQPFMANLRSLAARVGELAADEALEWIEQRLRALDELPELLATAAWRSVESAPVVVTLSRSGAVAAVVEGAWSRGWTGLLVVLEGPAGSGGLDQVEKMAALGAAILEPDARAAHWLDHPGAIVAVGADAIGENRFVNCLGTRALFELASARGVDRVVVADSGKDVAESVMTEIIGCSACRCDEIGRKWPIFEEVPVSLVTVRISEIGHSLC